MKTMVFATHNSGKLREMRDLLGNLSVSVLGAEEAGVHEDVVEDGETFEENARKKARFVTEQTGEWSVADDSGICIDALDGRPGVHTARWAGEGASDEDLVRYTLEQMKEVNDSGRTATFVSVLVLCGPSGEEHIFRGEARGHIPVEPVGEMRKKLPYDVIFIPEGEERTFAQMSEEEKHRYSHRGKAFEKLRKFLRKEV